MLGVIENKTNNNGFYFFKIFDGSSFDVSKQLNLYHITIKLMKS